MNWQVASQPSPPRLLPSSQTSVLSTTPLPHSSHAAPGTGHEKPNSRVLQSALQPSPDVRFASSHTSVLSTTPLPHWLQTVAVPPTTHVHPASSTLQSKRQPSPLTR